MGDYYSGEGGEGTGTGSGSSDKDNGTAEPKGKGKDKGTAEPKGKGKTGYGGGGFVAMDKEKIWGLYKQAKDRRLPDGGLVDGGLMV